MMKHGRAAMTEDELAYLARLVQGAKRYIEIGTLWGGSAIAAALANPKLRITCIDPFTGYYGDKLDPYIGDAPTAEAFWENCEAAGVRDRIRLIQAKSYPFPISTRERFDVGLVDGDHSEEATINDITNLYPLCACVLVHDIDRAYIQAAIQRNGYEIHNGCDRLGRIVRQS